MRRLVFYLLICFFVLSGVSIARDRSNPRDGIEDLARGKWWRIPEVANGLSISTDEQAKLDDLYYKHYNYMINLKSDLKKEQIAFRVVYRKREIGRISLCGSVSKGA